jgi:hypothetical protein
MLSLSPAAVPGRTVLEAAGAIALWVVACWCRLCAHCEVLERLCERMRRS